MLNKKIVKVVAAVTLGLVLNSTTLVNATKYEGPLNAESPVSAEITLPKEIVIPPIDPENPIVPPTEPTNPDKGNGLSLVYVSGLNFPKVEFDLNDSQTIVANRDSGKNDEDETIEFDNMVTVMDVRDERTEGWALRASQTEELFNGAVIKMIPKVYSNDMGVAVPPTFEVNTSPKDFASADGSGNAGIISIGMGDVELQVPAKTGVGEYSTTIKWELISEPKPIPRYSFSFKGLSDREFANMQISLEQREAVIKTSKEGQPHPYFNKYASILIENQDGIEKYNKIFIGTEKQTIYEDTVNLEIGDYITIFHYEPSRIVGINITTNEVMQQAGTSTYQVTENKLILKNSSF